MPYPWSKDKTRLSYTLKLTLQSKYKVKTCLKFHCTHFLYLVFSCVMCIVVLINALPYRPPQGSNWNIRETQRSGEKEKLHEKKLHSQFLKKLNPTNARFEQKNNDSHFSLVGDVDQSAYIFCFKNFLINNIKINIFHSNIYFHCHSKDFLLLHFYEESGNYWHRETLSLSLSF